MQRGIPGNYKQPNFRQNKIKPTSFSPRAREEEKAYSFCKKKMNAFFESPTMKSLKEFREAYNEYWAKNPTSANALMLRYKKMVFDKNIKESELQ